eukprot:GHVL01016173.1.p1 GENE.GHVL01016173.1~~GHVL01016173.1.p1  ORF type:complete len:385 (+),score=119.97 GHVL01016173.1:38-1156(+)
MKLSIFLIFYTNYVYIFIYGYIFRKTQIILNSRKYTTFELLAQKNIEAPPPPTAVGAPPGAEELEERYFPLFKGSAESPEQKDVLSRMETLQDEKDRLEEEEMKELEQIRRVYHQKFQRLFTERSDVLLEAASSSPPQLPPYFWAISLANHPDIRPLIASETDTDVLSFLNDIQISWLDNEDEEKGFEITFKFRPNNRYLQGDGIVKKTFELIKPSEMNDAEAFPVKKTYSEGLNFRAGVDTTMEVKNNNVQMIPSFFEIFKFDWPRQENAPSASLTEDEYKDAVQQQLHACLAIMEEVVPNAIDWFAGNDDLLEEWEKAHILYTKRPEGGGGSGSMQKGGGGRKFDDAAPPADFRNEKVGSDKHNSKKKNK